MCQTLMEHHEKIQIIFEDIRNQLSVLKGFIQLSSGKQIETTHETLLINSINEANNLIGQGFTTLETINNRTKNLYGNCKNF